MKYIKNIFFIVLFSSITLSAQKHSVDYVNVFTGTSNSRWMLFPGPSMPFGMVKLSPDNQENVWNGGYEYSIGSISGFSHLHGMSLSGVSYMPAVGELYFGEEYAKLFAGTADGPFNHMWTAGYRSRYDKNTEKGKPGYYSVDLLDYDIKVELTTTLRCGMIRCTFPKNEKSRFILDLDPPTEELNWNVKTRVDRINDFVIEGSITFSNQYADETTVYFKSKFSKAIESIDSWQYQKYKGEDVKYGTDWRRKCDINKGINTFEGGAKSGVVINFTTENNEVVTVSTGISFVSVKNASLNMEKELETLNYEFDMVVDRAQNEWNRLLSSIEVEGNEADKEKFYTNYYRSFTGKNLMSDVNGQYIDMCEQVQTMQIPADGVYSSDGLWGAQWNLFPLWTLVAPKYASSFANSLIELQKHGGWIPEAPVGLEYSPIMGAQHQNALLISAYQKGIASFDEKEVFEMIKHDYMNQGIDHPCGGFAGNRHMKDYIDYGYVPEETGAASNTLEYAFDDWCLGQFAEALGNKKDAEYFIDRSMNYKNLYNPETGYMQRKHKDGSWHEDFDPHRMGTEGHWNGPGYMEGNAWIYTWYVPQDIPGLMELLGENKFNNRLEEGFKKGYVDISNQPNLQAPFLFNYSGKPWLTQKYSRMVVDDMFNTSPYKGWVGEEDEGQMGALCTLLSMGLFEMKAGCSVEPYYDISSPVFDKIIIHFYTKSHVGKSFTIETKNNSKENIYIQSASLNGKSLTTPIIKHSDIIKGGKLLIELGPEPNEQVFNIK